MIWCRFHKNNMISYGIVEGDYVTVVDGDPFTEHRPSSVRVQEIHAVKEIGDKAARYRERPNRIRRHRVARAGLERAQPQFITEDETEVDHRGENSGKDTDHQPGRETGTHTGHGAPIALASAPGKSEQSKSQNHNGRAAD